MVKKGSVGGNVGEEVQRLMLKVVKLIASDGEEGVEEEAGGWGRDCRGLRPRHPTSRGDHTPNPQVHPTRP